MRYLILVYRARQYGNILHNPRPRNQAFLSPPLTPAFGPQEASAAALTPPFLS